LLPNNPCWPSLEIECLNAERERRNAYGYERLAPLLYCGCPSWTSLLCATLLYFYAYFIFGRHDLPVFLLSVRIFFCCWYDLITWTNGLFLRVVNYMPDCNPLSPMKKESPRTISFTYMEFFCPTTRNFQWQILRACWIPTVEFNANM